MLKANHTALLLVLNAGSSYIKFVGFDSSLRQEIAGIVEAIGGASTTKIAYKSLPMPFIDHKLALNSNLSALAESDYVLERFSAAAHRVIYGRRKLTLTVRLTPDIQLEISNSTPLAPLHNPYKLTAINTLAELAPDLPQYASFDTSLFTTNPKVAMRYAVPRSIQTKDIQRYGFYGLSFSSLVRQLPHVSGERLPPRLLAFYMGIDASLRAMRNGQSVATKMGYSQLDGLTMGTRSGGVDANAVLRLMEDNDGDRTKAILKHESGLLGLSGGKSDMHNLMLDPSADTAFAIENFYYWYLRYAESLVTAIEVLDDIAFTGGISKSALGIRPCILQGWGWTALRINPYSNHRHNPRLQAESSKVSIWIVPTKEEGTIAADALALIQAQ